MRFTSGCRALFQELFSGVNGERVRWLLPRAYGGTGKGKRRRDERVEGYFVWPHVGFARMVVSLVLPISVWRACVSAWKRRGRVAGRLFTEGGGWSTYSYVTTYHSSPSRDTSRCCIVSAIAQVRDHHSRPSRPTTWSSSYLVGQVVRLLDQVNYLITGSEQRYILCDLHFD